MNAILQVLPTFHAGGVEQTTLLVANALAEKGFKSLITSAGGILSKKLHPDVQHIYLPLDTKNPYLIFSNAKKIKQIILDNNVDIVHARSRAPGWSAYFAANSTKVNFVTTYHGSYSQNFFKQYYNKVMALGNPTIVASRYMENHVRKYYPNSVCVRIPSGINTEYFSPSLVNQSRIRELKSQWNVSDNEKILLLVGRFTRIKGHELLLQAVKLSSFKNQVTVVFVGDSKNPKLVDELKKQANELSLKLYICMDEKDLRPFFSMANVVVIPTVKPEAFGRVTVEAMSMERIVIGNDLGASSEIINNSKWIFVHNKVESLAQKIDEALSLTVEQAYTVGHENRTRVSNLYNIDTLVEGHIQVYKDILKVG